MTKRERQDREQMHERVLALGFTDAEFHQLRRISMTLHRWHEHECNGNIQRDGDDGEGNPRWYSQHSIENDAKPRGRRIPDRERGALERLKRIVDDRNAVVTMHSDVVPELSPGFLHAYVQGDPRGAALYLVPASELRGQPIESVYSRGVCIY